MLKPLLLGMNQKEKDRNGAEENRARKQIREEHMRKEDEIRNSCAPPSTPERHYPQVVKAIPYPKEDE